MSGSIYKIPLTVRTVDPIPANEKILENDITFTTDEFKVGKGGLLRLYFAFETSLDYELTITLSGTSGNILDLKKFKLNGDNDFKLLTDGYYRFDIGVDSVTEFNLSINAALEPADILELSLHKIVFGA